MAQEITLTVDNFAEEVLRADRPVLVDFWATWCGPCRMMAPIFEEVAEENDGSVKFAKANTDEMLNIAQEYNIASIPSLLLFQNGEVVKRSVGLQSKEEIEEMLR